MPVYATLDVIRLAVGSPPRYSAGALASIRPDF